MLEGKVFEDALLGFLMEGEGYGYDLAQHFEAGGDLASVGRLGRSQLYALLRALEEKGLAHSSLVEGEGGPARRVFRLTEEGEQRFRTWVGKPVPSIRGLRVEFLLKLYFLTRLRLPGREALLNAQRGILEGRLRELEAEEECRSGVGPWVVDLQVRLLRAGLEWIEEWRGQEPEVVSSGETRREPRPENRPERTNHLRAVVVGLETEGSMARVDLELGGGRVIALVPREDVAGLEVVKGTEVEAALPPGGLILTRPGRTTPEETR